MKILLRATTALAVAFGGLVALAGPAAAATPQVLYPNATAPGTPYAPDASVPILGNGCSASSPISLDIWDTSSSSSHIQLNNVTTASPSGIFSYSYDLDNQWDGGDTLGIAVTCGTTFDWMNSSNPLADRSYIQVQLADPFVEITAPSTARYGVARQVVVRNNSVHGDVVFTLDGNPLTFLPGAVYGWTAYQLPAGLSVGTHTLQATFDPQVAGAPTVTDTQTLRITKAVSRTALRSSVTRIRRNRAFAVRVTLTRTGIAPRTGVVEIRDGSRTVKRITIRASDHGTRRFLIRLPRTGPRNVKAVYLGNSKLASSRSAITVIRVRA